MLSFGLSPLGRARRRVLPDLPASPVALYLLNEGSGTAINDSSGNGHHAAVGAPAPAWSSVGLSYNGTNQVVLTPAAAAGGTSSATFLAVARLTSNGNFPYLVGSNATDQGLVVLFASSVRQPRMFVNTSGGSVGSTSAALSLNTWYMVAATFDYVPGAAGSLKGYANSSLISTIATPSNAQRTAVTNLRLGWGGTGSVTIADLAAVATYSRALSLAEIASAYAGFQTYLAGRGISL